MASETPETDRPEIAVIGGSGFYTFLDDAYDVHVETPYGPPSAPVSVGTVDVADRTGATAPRPVAFLPRHGRGHEFPAHRVNYRANMWALRSLGVRQVLAPCAVGGLRPDLGPGTLVVPDQLVDRTAGRTQTYFDSGACHIAFADPYCPRLRTALLDGLGGDGGRGGGSARSGLRDGGAMVVIAGPRFSTRAESQWYAAQGWSLVGMTGHPEAVLARELELCYASVALVTDLDAGIDADSAVSQDKVFEVFAEHIDLLRDRLRGVAAALPRERVCDCSEALAGMTVPVQLP
ncbi:MAG: S-methyl-5'-thioadenosine phosphorylase [Nocardioidaceae bacterium]